MIKKERPEPIAAPMIPPINPVARASEIKLNIIVREFAPRAFNIPISFVLSMTEVNSVVMIAMNATRTEILPTASRRVPVDWVTDVIVERIELTEVILASLPYNAVSSEVT